MSNRRVISQAGVGRFTRVLALSGLLIAACQPSGLDDPPSIVVPTGTPIQQDDRIPIEIDVNGEWVAAHPSLAGLERFAQQWCARSRRAGDDAKLCANAGTTTGTTVPSDLPGCNASLCAERNSVCAGYIFEEMAKSPQQRVLDPRKIVAGGNSTVGGTIAVRLDSTGLDLSKAELDGFGRTLPDLKTPRLRFQPLDAPGRAAALRAALDMFRDSARVASILRTQASPSDGVTCLLRFGLTDLAKTTPTGLDPSADGTTPTWTDVFYATFMDGANEYMTVLPEAITAMREAAALEVKGVNALPDEVATEWNGNANSATAVARLLAVGEPPPSPGGVKALSAPIWSPAVHFAAEIGPSGVPVCPPVTGNVGLVKAISLVRGLRVSPLSASNTINFADTVVDAYREDQVRAGVVSSASDLDKTTALTRLGVTDDDLRAAGTYLGAETAAFGVYHTPQPPAAPLSGVTSVPRYWGVQTPAQSLPAGAYAAHFLGTPLADPSPDLDGASYAAGGAMRTLDQLKRDAASLKSQAIGGTVSPTIYQSMLGIAQALDAAAGKQRLEFLIGHTKLGDAAHVDKVYVRIHGVPTSGDGSTDKYELVQGLDGLKCSISKTIDGAPCNPADFRISMDDAPQALDSRMTDLDPTSRTLEHVLTSVRRPGAANGAISTADAIYIVRVHGAMRQAFGGVVPTPDDTSALVDAASPPGMTRRVFAPAGGMYDEVLKNALTPNSDDCSHVEHACVDGLPFTFWPPLESEINGTPSSAQAYESSWSHYLDLAEQAAAEADKLGEELLNQGLSMDKEAKLAKSELVDLCGADNGAQADCSTKAGEEVPWVMFGDKPACLWKVDDTVCACPVDPAPGKACPVPCPMLLPADQKMPIDDDAAQRQICADLINKAAAEQPLKSQLQVIPVPYVLGFGKTGTLPTPDACGIFQTLRSNEKSSVKREEFIRSAVMPAINQEQVTAWAANIHYTEAFADNYRLTYANHPIFETARPIRPAWNSASAAPCNVAPGDKRSGAPFWTQPIQCYASGVGADCSTGYGTATSHKGADGCPGLSHTNADLTLDTEYDALRARWAWGFGHLRRSVAVLGVITGALDRLMTVGTIVQGGSATLVWNGFGFTPAYVPSTLAGIPGQVPSTALLEPGWVEHTSPLGRDEFADQGRCVRVDGVKGPWGESNRAQTGRPVNSNAWLSPVYATVPTLDPSPNPYIATVVHDFPCVQKPGESVCIPSGADPQMPYCASPVGWSVAIPYAQWPDDYGVDLDAPIKFTNPQGYAAATAYVGSAVFLPATFNGSDAAWTAAVNDMWAVPESSEHFCANSLDTSLHGAIWRAMCSAPNDVDAATLLGDTAFMTKGEYPEDGILYANRSVVGSWLHVGDVLWGSAHLFDMSQPFATAQFQYALSQRNIIDALELACHAANASAGMELPSCDSLDATKVPDNPQSVDDLVGVARCIDARVRKIASNTVIGPVPKAVALAFLNAQPISSTAGFGGKYLDDMVAEYNGLSQYQEDLAHIGDGVGRIVSAAYVLAQLDKRLSAQKQGAHSRQLASALTTAARIADEMADMVSPGKNTISFGTSGTAHAYAIAFLLGAAAAEWSAFDFDVEADEAQTNIDRAHVKEQLIDAAAEIRAAASDATLQLNNITNAAADLRAVGQNAAVAQSVIDWSDTAGASNDPQFVNIVNRRVYNTLLIRYREAVDRAKKLAFIARRAIELRFGVDLSRMHEPMTLVDAPVKWANRVCTLEGIDYAKIRQPNPDAGVSSYKFGEPPPPGDEFASEFIGDYVKLLRDFVNSYPIDKPLKDGDDIGVVSLGDDVFGVHSVCNVPSANRLYYSADLGSRDRSDVSEEMRGWMVGECGRTRSADVDGGASSQVEWRGCIAVNRVGGDARLEVPDGGVDPGPDAEGLPTSAVPMRLANQGCLEPSVSLPGIPDPCPVLAAGETYQAVGALEQRLDDLTAGYYFASLYVKADPRYNASEAYGSGTLAALRVVRDVDGAVLPGAELTFVPTGKWQRLRLTFLADQGERYRLQIVPSTQPIAIVQNAVDGGEVDVQAPSLLVAAAQVEKAPDGFDPQGSGPIVVKAWQRTHDQRTIVSTSCPTDGAALRARFERKCEYVCKDGIHTGCAGADSDSVPSRCFYEAKFNVSLDELEAGRLIPSGQVAIGNCNYRHNEVGLNLVGSGITDCGGQAGQSCYGNGFVEFTLSHSGDTSIRNWDGATMPVHMDRAFIEHGKALAAERVVSNPPSANDTSLMQPYMKDELKGRPIEGQYTLRIWDSPTLRWEQVQDVQLVWRYHYWTRFQH